MGHPGRPRKCDPKISNLCYSIRQGELNTIKKTLQEFGIDATDGEGRTVLINAVSENKPAILQWLLDNGANINNQDRVGYTALHFCGQNGFFDIAKYLVDNGANPNLQDIYGNTPLSTAIHSARVQPHKFGIVKMLLNHGADPDISNNYDSSPRKLFQLINNTDISAIDTVQI